MKNNLDVERNGVREYTTSLEKNDNIIIEVESKTDICKPDGLNGVLGSFMPMENAELDINSSLTENQKIDIKMSQDPLQRSLSKKYSTILATGAWVATGFLVVLGIPFRAAGPLGSLLAYIIIASIVFCTVQALGELSAAYPTGGAFIKYNIRFIDKSWGFAMSWNYYIQYLMMFPLELYALSITIQYWDQKTNPSTYIAVFYTLIILINIFGFKGYGNAELILAAIKLITIAGFVVCSLVFVCGGGPTGEYFGGSYWNDPGSFSHGFKGICFAFATSAFAFARTELVGVAAASSLNPREALRRVAKHFLWRTLLIYLIPLIFVGFLVSYDDEMLLGAGPLKASCAPFTLAIKRAGVQGLTSVMNAVILISVFFIGINSINYSGRTLASLAACGQAPKVCGYIDKEGRPIVAILIQAVVGTIAFSRSTLIGDIAVDFCLLLSSVSSIFTWMSINFSYIRFRRAMSVQARDPNNLPCTSLLGVWGAVYACVISFLVLAGYFWTALFPLGKDPDAEEFFKAGLCYAMVFVFYFGHKLTTKDWRLFYRASDIDIDTEMTKADVQKIEDMDRHVTLMRKESFFARLSSFWC